MSESYLVSFQKVQVVKRKTGSSYRVRWTVEGKRRTRNFATLALADSWRAALVQAARAGVAFSISTGLPLTMERAQSVTWYKLAQEYAALKWPHSAPKHRQSIAEGLACVSVALVAGKPCPYSERQLRVALYGWAFNKGRAGLKEVPQEIAGALNWYLTNGPEVSVFQSPQTVHRVLDALALRLDGKPAAPNTVRRKRTVFQAAVKFGVQMEYLASNPFDRVARAIPRSSNEVDRRSVANPAQARALLDWFTDSNYPDLKAFFGCMYYAALRPEEVLHLRAADYVPPETEGGWGWLNLTGSTVTSGMDWSGSDSIYLDQPLKHRSSDTIRPVPVAPELAQLLNEHLEKWPCPPGRRLFVARRGATPMNPLGSSTYARIWKRAREAVLTPAQVASPLAQVPYDLRHAAVSLWLNAGVPPAQVAEWAGHSVDVLLRVYAKCVDGGQVAAMARIEETLQQAWAR